MSYILSNAVRYLQHPQIKGSIKSILSVQLAHADNNGTNIFPSINTIAEQAGISKRMVSKGINVLKNILLEEEHDNRYRMKKYRLKNELFLSLISNGKVKERVRECFSEHMKNCTNMNELCAEYDAHCIKMMEHSALQDAHSAHNSIQYSINLDNTKNKQRAREADPKPTLVEQPKAIPSIAPWVDSVCVEPTLVKNFEIGKPNHHSHQPEPEDEPLPKTAVKHPTQSSFLIQKDFEVFWTAYVLKVGKGGAQKAFERAMKKFELQAKKSKNLCSGMGNPPKIFLETILGALEAQKAEREVRDSLGLWSPPWKHPSTWLDQECWNDVPKTLEELQKEAGTKQISRPPIQKKPNFMDEHHTNMKVWQKMGDTRFPELSKYFYPGPRHNGSTASLQPQLRQELVINELQ